MDNNIPKPPSYILKALENILVASNRWPEKRDRYFMGDLFENLCCTKVHKCGTMRYATKLDHFANRTKTQAVCLKLLCTHCNSSWYVCYNCNKRFERNKNMEEHYDNYHNQNQTTTVNNNQCTDTGEPVGASIRVSGFLRTTSGAVNTKKLATNCPISSLLADQPRATLLDLQKTFKDTEMMKKFWVAEHAHPGGGFQYLVGRAFSGLSCPSAKLPSHEEARWHMKNFIHNLSLSEKQRKLIRDQFQP